MDTLYTSLIQCLFKRNANNWRPTQVRKTTPRRAITLLWSILMREYI